MLSESESDDTLFVKEFLFKISVDPTISAIEFKHKIVDHFNSLSPELQSFKLLKEKIRIRNPKSDDLGDVIKDYETLEN